MASEIKQLLVRIEEEQLAMRRGLTGLASVARHDFITARQQNIDQAHTRLLELCGPQATSFVQTTIEQADLLYGAEQARIRIRQHIERYKMMQAQTQELPALRR